MTDLQKVADKIAEMTAARVWLSEPHNAVYIDVHGKNHVAYVGGGKMPTQDEVDAMVAHNDDIEPTKKTLTVDEQNDATTMA